MHCFHIRRRLSQDAFAEREQPVGALGSDESIFRNFNRANVAKSLLDGSRDQLLTQTRSELMKQEQKVECLSNCSSEFSNKLMLNDWNWRTRLLRHVIFRDYRKMLLQIHVRHLSHHKHLSRYSSFCDTNCCRWGSGAHEHRGTCCKRGRTNWKRNPNADVSKTAVNHELILSYLRKFHKIQWLYIKDCRFRSFSLTNFPHLERFHVGR